MIAWLANLPTIVSAAIGFTAFLLMLMSIAFADDWSTARAARRRRREEFQRARLEATGHWRPAHVESPERERAANQAIDLTGGLR